MVPRTYRTFNLPDNGYFDRKFGIAVTSYNGCVITKGMAPFIAPLREGGSRRRLVPSAGGRARIEWVYDADAVTKLATVLI